MSNIARRLTGLTKSQLHEYNVPSVASKKNVFKSRCTNLRQNVRLAGGLIVGTNDLDNMRDRLKKSTPKSLQS
jgi:hypothetical protein